MNQMKESNLRLTPMKYERKEKGKNLKTLPEQYQNLVFKNLTIE